MDKHNTLHLGLVFPQQNKVTVGPGRVHVKGYVGPVEDQTVVLTVRVPEQETDPTMDMELNMTFDVGFGSVGPVYGWPVRNTLTEILACVVGIAGELDPFVPEPPEHGHLQRPPIRLDWKVVPRR